MRVWPILTRKLKENLPQYRAEFIPNVIDFAIVFFVMFMVIRTVSEIKTPPPAAATSGASDNDLLSESRDLLKK